MDIFGGKSGEEVDKFKKSGIKTESANQIDSPLLEEATINFECKLEKQIDVGACTLFLGRILESHLNKDKNILYNFGKGYGEYTFKELKPSFE